MLKNKGYDILHRNLKLNNIEVDIIARDGKELCFVEVKTRHYKGNNKKVDSIVWLRNKQAVRIEKAAKRYISRIGGQKIKYRFELVELYLSSYAIMKISHWHCDFGRNNSA